MLGQVNPHLSLFARQNDVAQDQLGRQDAVDAGPERVVVAQSPVARVDVGRHPAQEHVGIDDLRALARRVPGLDQRGARARGVEDLRALRCAQGRDTQRRCVENLHGEETVGER